MENWRMIQDEFINPLDGLEPVDSPEIPAELPAAAEIMEDDEPIEEEELNPFKLIASELGINFEGEDAEEFKASLKEQAKQEFLSQTGLDNPEIADMIKYLSEGGDVREYLELVSQMPDLTKYSDEQIYSAYLKNTSNFPDAKILKLVKQAIDSDELSEEVVTAKEYFSKMQEHSIKELKKNQEELHRQKQEQLKQETVLKKDILNKKAVLGQVIEKPKEFEKYYFERNVLHKEGDQTYKLTEYEKDLVELNKDPKKRIEYEMMIAYLHHTKFKLTPQQEKEIKANTISDLKNQLRGHYNKKTSSTLIDEY